MSLPRARRAGKVEETDAVWPRPLASDKAPAGPGRETHLATLALVRGAGPAFCDREGERPGPGSQAPPHLPPDPRPRAASRGLKRTATSPSAVWRWSCSGTGMEPIGQSQANRPECARARPPLTQGGGRAGRPHAPPTPQQECCKEVPCGSQGGGGHSSAWSPCSVLQALASGVSRTVPPESEDTPTILSTHVRASQPRETLRRKTPSRHLAGEAGDKPAQKAAHGTADTTASESNPALDSGHLPRAAGSLSGLSGCAAALLGEAQGGHRRTS